jgi:hypothetical protein
MPHLYTQHFLVFHEQTNLAMISVMAGLAPHLYTQHFLVFHEQTNLAMISVMAGLA